MLSQIWDRTVEANLEMMAIRRTVLQELLGSERWSRRLESAETVEEVASVLEAFCRRYKREVVCLSPEGKESVAVVAA